MTSAKTIATVNAAIDLKRNTGSMQIATELLKKAGVKLTKPEKTTRQSRASSPKRKREVT